jgi:hypothetical protein
VVDAAAGHPLLAFETLVPDVRVYFPTGEDALAYDAIMGG